MQPVPWHTIVGYRLFSILASRQRHASRLQILELRGVVAVGEEAHMDEAKSRLAAGVVQLRLQDAVVGPRALGKATDRVLDLAEGGLRVERRIAGVGVGGLLVEAGLEDVSVEGLVLEGLAPAQAVQAPLLLQPVGEGDGEARAVDVLARGDVHQAVAGVAEAEDGGPRVQVLVVAGAEPVVLAGVADELGRAEGLV